MKSVQSLSTSALTALFLISSAPADAAQERQEPTYDSTKTMFKTLYPALRALKEANDQGGKDAIIAAEDKVLEAQKNITDFFGEGAEGQHTYDYPVTINGQTTNVRKVFDVDCDAAFLQINKGGALSLDPTTNFVVPFHASLPLASGQYNETKMRNFGKNNFIPLKNASASAFAHHLFNMNDGKPSTHNVPYSLTTEMLNAHCRAGLKKAQSYIPQVVGDLQKEGYFDEFNNN